MLRGGVILLSLLGCHPAWVVVSDLHGDRAFVTNASTGHIAGEVDVDGTWTDDCRASDDLHRFGLVYQSRGRALPADSGFDGVPEVDLTFTPVGSGDETDGDTFLDLGGRVAGVAFTDGYGETPVIRWQLDHLDFSQVDPDQQVCVRDPADPCRPLAGQTVDQVRACQLYWPHELQVVSEDDDSVQVVVADTRNHRVVWVDVPLLAEPTATPPTHGTCGVVTEIVGGSKDPSVPGGSADWDIYTSVNGMNLWDDDAGRHLYLSIKDTLGDDAQSPGDGRGKILHWSDAGGWHQEWEFPPESTDAESFVNSPHGIGFDDDHVYFAHSLGRSDTFNDGEGGSFGVLDRDGGYLYDLVLPRQEVIYARDITPLGDGRFAVVDSGTKGDEHEPAATRLWVAKLPKDTTASGLGGAWSSDHADQEFREGTVVDSPKYPDAWVLYTAELVPEP